jgi:TonB-linked SusC/RagA family outer membrane protein
MKKINILLFCLFLGIGLVSAQTKVTGTVIFADDGEPVVGATVVAKGTNVAAVTDIKGAFTLNAPGSAKTLSITYLGMVPQEVTIAPVVNVTLQTNTHNLDEVVVVGYGTQRKKDVTSSISSVKGSVVAEQASPSFMQSLAGRAAGVQIVTGTGDVTAPPRVAIRGVGTISSDKEPLYVINGIPVTSTNLKYSYANNNALADINQSDIESFDILKDGAATAIYGSRAANGVVLITTKQGKQGSAKVTYDGWIGSSSPSKLYDLLNAEQFVTIANEKFAAAGTPAQAFLDEKGTNTNWYDHVFRTGTQQSHSVSISGATPKTNYYLSAGYTNQKGVIIANDYKRYTFNARADQKILKDYASIGFTLNASSQNNSGPLKGTSSLSDNMYAASRMLPNVSVYNPDDPTGFNIESSDRKSLGKGANLRTIDLTIPNIMWSLTNNHQNSDSYRLLPTANIDIKPTSYLTFRSLVGADLSLVDDGYSWRPESGDGFGYNGLISKSSIKRQRWNFQNILTFNKNFGLHHVDATAVAEWTNYEYSRFSGGGRDFSDPFFVDRLISSTYVTQTSGGSWTTTGLTSYIFRGNYNYNSLLYLGGSVRRDGISVLDPSNRWGTFPGGSAALRISQFSFWKESGINDVVSDFRLRGSLAQVGNDRLNSEFMYKDFFSGEKYGGQAAIAYSQAGNTDLKWETQKISDFGFDAGLLNGRFNFVFAYWSKDNSNIVLDVPQPPSLGIPDCVIPQNYGKITNHGIELELGGNIIEKDNLVWKSSLNFSTQKSQVVSLVEEIPYEHFILREGESVYALYGYRYAGANQANGNPMYYKADGSIVQGNVSDSKYYLYDPSDPASLKVPTAEEAKEGKTANLVADDKAILGNSLPTWFGGWDNTVTYKGFDLNIFFRYSGGNKVANITRRDMLNQQFLNNSTEILGRWQSPEQPGDGQTPRLWYGRAGFINLDGNGLDRWVEDGKFLKLQNIALGYTLPKNVTKVLMVEKVRVYAQIQNAYTWTKYSGLDPESYTALATSGVQGGVTGIDWNGNPQQRTFLFGLNVAF